MTKSYPGDEVGSWPQQEAEARGDEPVDVGGDEEAAEGEESAPAEAAAEGTPSPEGGTEPTQS